MIVHFHLLLEIQWILQLHVTTCSGLHPAWLLGWMSAQRVSLHDKLPASPPLWGFSLRARA